MVRMSIILYTFVWYQSACQLSIFTDQLSIINNTYCFPEKPLPPKRINLDDTEIILEKAIKAAEAAGLTMTKIPTYTYKEVEIKEDMPTIHDRNLLAELNSDSFAPKSFTSSRNKKESKNIVIDLNTQTVKMPETEIKQKDDSIIDFNVSYCFKGIFHCKFLFLEIANLNTIVIF